MPNTMNIEEAAHKKKIFEIAESISWLLTMTVDPLLIIGLDESKR
jgi:hypothetical protein